MGTFTNIELALHTRLSTLDNSPPVAWPNIEFTPTENEIYLRPTILPTSTQLDTVAGNEEHKGLYQIDIFVPLENGVKDLNTLLDAIETLFKSNKTIISSNDLIFIQAISRGKAQRQDSWYVSFVEVNYLCYS